MQAVQAAEAPVQLRRRVGQVLSHQVLGHLLLEGISSPPAYAAGDRRGEDQTSAEVAGSGVGRIIQLTLS